MCFATDFRDASQWPMLKWTGLGFHADNDAAQAELFEGLFAGLLALKEALNNTVDTNGR